MSPWTPQEDALVREYWAALGVDGLVPKLPGRTRNAIRTRAHNLGVPGPRRRKRRALPRQLVPAADPLRLEVLASRAMRRLPLFGRRRTS